jgi:hypothetical protein
MSTTITLAPDRSVVIESETHLCRLPAWHPETLAPWPSPEAAQAFAECVAHDPRYMLPKPAPPPKRMLVSPGEYFGLFSPLEEFTIREAAKDSTDAARILAIFLRRLDHPALTQIDLASAQVQQGLDLLVEMGLISPARRAEIGQGL